LFDTYYEIKNLAEQEKVVEVNETTPRFRKFYIRNIYCNGAEQAVKITGLPEMPVRDVEFSNMVISARSGFSSREAANIRLDNVSIIPGRGVSYSLENSRDFLMKKLVCPPASDLFMRLEGAATGNIRVESTDLSKCNDKFEFGKGTQKSAVIVTE
ncbi:MAG: hypothetical protein Q8907_16375, partial [Bacteroidota bacterium]|nr:hypothetical protein [Bacteroidota bacterium]